MILDRAKLRPYLESVALNESRIMSLQSKNDEKKVSEKKPSFFLALYIVTA